MENDVRRYLSKHTSMSNIKVEEVPKCEADIMRVQDMIDQDTFMNLEMELDDYTRGLAYFFGIGNIRNDEAGLSHLRKAAEEGNIDAMNMYGFACYHSSLSAKNQSQKMEWYIRQALKWYGEAAKMGQVEAIFNLGVSYLEGLEKEKSTEESTREGMRYLETAEKLGHPRAKLYIEDYKQKHGLGKAIEREGKKDDILSDIQHKMKERMEKEGIKSLDQSMKTGLFNEIYLEIGYEWIKTDNLGWICSKDDGKTYLILESELEEL